MELDINTIITSIKSGQLTRNADEAYAGGFWDLAGELAPNNQEQVYNALWEVVEGLS